MQKNGAELLRLWTAAARLPGRHRLLADDPQPAVRVVPEDPQHLPVPPVEPLRLRAGARSAWTIRSAARARPAGAGRPARARPPDLRGLPALLRSTRSCACMTDYVITVSAEYLDPIKDPLYCEAPGSPVRRSVQTALYEMTRTLVAVDGARAVLHGAGRRRRAVARHRRAVRRARDRARRARSDGQEPGPTRTGAGPTRSARGARPSCRRWSRSAPPVTSRWKRREGATERGRAAAVGVEPRLADRALHRFAARASTRRRSPRRGITVDRGGRTPRARAAGGARAMPPTPGAASPDAVPRVAQVPSPAPGAAHDPRPQEVRPVLGVRADQPGARPVDEGAGAHAIYSRAVP